MRASRLLTILITLQMRGRVTAGALADQLEVSKRTIYRDIDELSAAGIPVQADRGLNGGFVLMDGFRTELNGLTEAETEALLLAGLPSAAADLGLAGPASAARLKLLDSMSPASRESAQRVAERFHIDPVEWYQKGRAPRHLQTTARAVWEGRQLELRYESWTRTSSTVVEPLGLVLKAGRWYLVAAAGAKTRIYNVDKIIDATTLEVTFTRPVLFDLPAIWKESVARFESDLKKQSARLRMLASSLPRLEAIDADMAVPLMNAAIDSMGWREAVVPIESFEQTAALLLSFGDHVEVIEPDELRAAIVERAARVVSLYSDVARRS